MVVNIFSAWLFCVPSSAAPGGQLSPLPPPP